MPRDGFQRARNRDIAKRAKLEIATYGRRLENDLIESTPAHDLRAIHVQAIIEDKKRKRHKGRQRKIKLTDWLNKIRRKAGRLAAKIPEFRTAPARGDTSALMLFGYALSNLSLDECILMQNLVECVGEAGIDELKNLQTSTNKTIKKNAVEVLRLVSTEAKSVNATDKKRRANDCAPTSTAAARVKTPPAKQVTKGGHTSKSTTVGAAANTQSSGMEKGWNAAVNYWKKKLMTENTDDRVRAINWFSTHRAHALSALPLILPLTRHHNYRIRKAAVRAVSQIESARIGQMH